MERTQWDLVLLVFTEYGCGTLTWYRLHCRSEAVKSHNSINLSNPNYTAYNPFLLRSIEHFKNKFKGESRYVNGETSSVFFLLQKMLITGSLTSEIRVQFPLLDTWLAYSPFLSGVARSDSNGSAWRNVPLKQSLLRGVVSPRLTKRPTQKAIEDVPWKMICLI